MTSPLIVTFVQATILNAISNILAQLIDQRNNKVRKLLTMFCCLNMTINKLPGSIYSKYTCSSPISGLWSFNRGPQFLLATRPGSALSRIPYAFRALRCIQCSITEIHPLTPLMAFSLLKIP